MVYRFMFVSTRMGRYRELLDWTHSQVRGSLGDGHSGAQISTKTNANRPIDEMGRKGLTVVGETGV